MFENNFQKLEAEFREIIRNMAFDRVIAVQAGEHDTSCEKEERAHKCWLALKCAEAGCEIAHDGELLHSRA